MASNAAGFHIFNGDGTGTDTVTFTLGGATALSNSVNPITYTVNADCTGSFTVLNGPSFGLFIAPDGEGQRRQHLCVQRTENLEPQRGWGTGARTRPKDGSRRGTSQPITQGLPSRGIDACAFTS